MAHSKKIRAALSIVAVIAASTLTGCASIVNGTTQVVSVETRDASGPVTGASCKMENDKGVFYVTTPGTVSVRRAYADMVVRCEKAGLPVGIASIKSSTKGMVAGNLIFGGVIGAGVDVASGAAYDYPPLMQILMGDTGPATMPVPAGGAPAPAAGPLATGASK